MEPFSCAQVRTDKTSIQTLSWGYFTWMWSILKPLCRLRNKGFAPVSRRSWVRIPLEPLWQKRCPEPSLFLAKIFLSSTTLHFLRFSTLCFSFFLASWVTANILFPQPFCHNGADAKHGWFHNYGSHGYQESQKLWVRPTKSGLTTFLPHSWNPMDRI